MKQNLFYVFTLSLLFLFGGANSLKAQDDRGYQAKPLSPKYEEMAKQVLAEQVSDPDHAYKIFNKMLRKARGDNEDMLSIGDYFLRHKVYSCANLCSKELYKEDPKYIPGLMFAGQVAMYAHNWGAAGQKYDEVLLLDTANVAAMKQNAWVYKNVNPAVAMRMLKKIKRLAEKANDSVEILDSDKQMGDISYNLSNYKDAVESYKPYFAKVNSSDIDLRSAENYLLSLYAVKQFFDLAKNAKKFQEIDPKDIIFHRMNFFGDIENYELNKAQESGKYILEHQYPDSDYMYLDYVYAANLKNELGKLPDAIEYYKKALQLDSTKIEGYKQLSQLYRKSNNSLEAVKAYQTYVSKLGAKAQLTDSFRLAEAFTRASQDTLLSSPQREEFRNDADKILEIIEAKVPDSYQATLLRARLFQIPGKPVDKVKEMYQKVLKRAGSEEKVKGVRIEAYSYILYYDIQKDLKDDAKVVCTDLLQLDPTNGLGLKAKKYLNM